MLEVGQSYVGPSGDSLSIDSKSLIALSGPDPTEPIFMATRSFEGLAVGVLVTEQGLIEAGYELRLLS